MRPSLPGPAPRGSTRGRLRLHRDPVLWGLAAAGAVCVLFFLVGPGGYPGRLRFFWLAQVPCDAALSVLSWQVRGLATGPARRFWAVLAGSALLWTVGDGTQTAIVLAGHTELGLNGGPVQTACFTVAAAALVVAMLWHPNAARSGRRRAAYWLDATTIVTGGAVLAWCFAVDPDADGGVPVATIVGVAVILASSYAAVKMVLGGHAPLTTRAAAPMILATLVTGSGLFAVPTNGTTFTPAQMVWRFLPSVLLLAGPRIQQVQARTDPATFAPRGHKPYSLLPYAAIAATLAAELVALPAGPHARVWGTVAGALVVTLLVVGRQLVAFHDNSELIRRLDGTLVDLREQERRLVEQASTDSLTGLANRAVLVREMSRGLGSGADAALLLIDIDDFKTVNDTLGHPAGDLLLVRVAEALRAATGPADLVARLGGDEFAVLLHGGDARVDAVATRILAGLATPVHIEGRDLVVRATIGVAMATPGDDRDALLRNADIALYAAKDGGKGRYARYAPEMGLRIQRAATLAARLERAVEGGEFFLVYQPIVRLADGSVTGAEALVRWRPPDGAVVPPDQFIPVAEDTGLIVPIGRWVLREACRQAALWRRDHGRPDFLVHVNVAGRQLREPGFLDDVAAALADAGLPSACLTVEVTENALLRDDAAIAVLHGLRELGVSVALDDFGTAASSLGLLLTCPVTALKLDRTFVESITTVARQAAVARAVVDMANALCLHAVAEGIETTAQADLLRGMSYPYAQGYLFSRPLTAEDFARDWLRRDPRAHDERVGALPPAAG